MLARLHPARRPRPVREGPHRWRVISSATVARILVTSPCGIPIPCPMFAQDRRLIMRVAFARHDAINAIQSLDGETKPMASDLHAEADVMSTMTEYGREFVFGPWLDWSGGACPLLDYENPEVRY